LQRNFFQSNNTNYAQPHTFVAVVPKPALKDFNVTMSMHSQDATGACLTNGLTTLAGWPLQ
jgi:hypothetical protein